MSIPVPVALEVIYRKLSTHISQEGLQAFLGHSHSIPKDKIISLLDLVLINCVFSFQHKFYKQLQGSAMVYQSPQLSQILIWNTLKNWHREHNAPSPHPGRNDM